MSISVFATGPRPEELLQQLQGQRRLPLGVVGGGAIGSYYAALLAAGGHDVVLLTRGAHLDVVRTRGLELRTSDRSVITHPTATDDPARLNDRDLVIVAVKGYSLPDVGDALAGAAQHGATIVPLLNGADVAERLEALGVLPARIAGGLAAISVVRTAPGVVERKSPADVVIVGDFAGRTNEVLRPFVNALRVCGTNATLSDDIARDLWRKFAFIVPITIGCGLARAPIGPLQQSARGRALLGGALDEIIAVSRAVGKPLTDDDREGVWRNLLAVQPHVKPSFLLDLERGGQTELDLLAGTVVRMACEHGIAVPIHDVAVAAFEAASVALGTGL